MSVHRFIDAEPEPPRDAPVAVWRMALPETPPNAWGWRAGAAAFGIALTAAAAGYVWQLGPPDTVVQARVLAEGGSDATGRAALAEAAFRLQSAIGQPAMLEDGGAALVITVRDREEDAAMQRIRSMVDAVLNTPVSLPALPAAATLIPQNPRTALLARRSQAMQAEAAVETHAASVSASLASLSRDMAGASRVAADRRPGRETLDKGAAMLADLQLTRLQLLTKYQDDYPAVTAVEGQIRTLRAFLADEQRRVDAPPARPANDPADLMLAAERDRLRAEQAELADRQRALVTEVETIDRSLASLPASSAPPAPPVQPDPPMLVQASTVARPGPDGRATTLALIAGAGIVLSALLAALPWHRRRRAPALLLHPRQLAEMSAITHEGMVLLPPHSALPLHVAGGRRGMPV